MSQAIEIELPDELASLKLPPGVDQRLQMLLTKQDEGVALSADEQQEAEGLVELAELLSLLQLRARPKN